MIRNSKQLGEEFLALSENLTKTCVIPKVISDDLDFYHGQVMEVLKNISSKERAAKFRVWIDKKVNEEYHKKVSEPSLLEDENLEVWAKRIFGDVKFGMIINNIEFCVPELSKKILDVLQPIIEQTKIPAGGFDIALFVGNYGWTPLGVHKDFDGGKVIHFHLGPGPKTIFQWDDETYQRLTSSAKNFMTPEKIIDHASRYHFEAGDIYFMNEEVWHVGLSEELSVGIAFWFNQFNRNEVFKRLSTYLKDRLLFEKDTKLSAFSKETLKEEKIDFPLNTNNPYAVMVEKFYQVLYEDYKLEMLSNGGFYTPIAKREGIGNVQLSYWLKVAEPFKIYHKQIDEERMILFIRGHQLSVFNHPSLPSMIDRINTGQDPIQLSDLLEPLLEDWSEEVAFYVINLLFVHGGIELYENHPTTHVKPALQELGALANTL